MDGERGLGNSMIYARFEYIYIYIYICVCVCVSMCVCVCVCSIKTAYDILILKRKHSVVFNRICLDNGLCPKYTVYTRCI